MRFVARCATYAAAQLVAEEVESLYLCGPAGGGGVTRHISEVIAIASTLMPAGQAHTDFEIRETRDAVA
jgi:hypothetical protein